MLGKVDLAWAAGLFEGERCFTLSGKSPQAVLAMSDHDVVRRFSAVVGVGALRNRPKFSVTVPAGGLTRTPFESKPLLVWSACGFQNVQAVAAMLWTWLGNRRRARATEILAIARTAGLRPGAMRRKICASGHPITGDGHGRHCKMCKAAAKRRRRMCQK